MLSVPKATTPLAKFIRTGEGVLVFAFNLAMLIVPIVSSALTPGQAIKYAAILNGVTVIARTALKIIALPKWYSLAAAIQTASDTTTATPTSTVIQTGSPGTLASTAPTQPLPFSASAAPAPSIDYDTELQSAPSDAEAAPPEARVAAEVVA